MADTLPTANTGSLLGAVNAAANAGQIPAGNLPWLESVVKSPFFLHLDPRGELWDKLLTYRLVVIDTNNQNQVVNGNKPQEVSYYSIGNGTIAFTALSNAWEIHFPITPQQLSITDQYAIKTTATLRGVLEEHSGTRFKNITVQGTFGVWPGRDSIVSQPGTPNLLQSVFAGTIASATNVATQFQSVINNITNGSNASKPVTIRPGSAQDSENGLGTGYYQTLMLTQFLEQYTEAKKDPANSGWRLVFDIPKQNQSFVVTPVMFTWNENVNKPMEINYNIQFKAWRRIDLQDNLVSAPFTVTQLTPGVLQTILNTISAAQNTVASVANLVGAVRSDVDNILNVIRQTGLFVKGLAGVALAVSDLPAQLQTDMQSTWTNFLATINPSNLSGAAATDQTTLTTIANIKALNSTNEGLSLTNVANGQLGSSAIASATLNPSNAMALSPLKYPLLLGQVPVNSLTLNTAQQNAVQTELNNVNSFTVQDLKNMRGTILSLCLQLSNSFGSGDAYYSSLFNLPAPTVTVEPIDLDQYDILDSLYELLQSYDVLTATNQINNNQILNSMQYVNALAATSNIEFNISNSKIQVPVPAGLNMEQIAMRYLGDPQRWLEIATLNSLREPYLDQNGFQYSLLSNADGRNVVVGSNQDLHIGQTVYLYSSTQAPTARTIIGISQLSLTSFLLTLDGLANLSNYTTVDQAYLQAYLPGTVNSMNTIFVPSNLVSPPDDMINIPEQVANVDLVGLSKVDWLLTPQGDIATDNQGSFQLAAGLTNLVQALTIKFGTTLGTSLLNPDFGLGISPGRMNADFSAATLYNQITNLITADPRFSGVSGLQIALNGAALGINLAVGLSGISGLFPISFSLPTTQ